MEDTEKIALARSPDHFLAPARKNPEIPGLLEGPLNLGDSPKHL
jgi:hypothetical protein